MESLFSLFYSLMDRLLPLAFAEPTFMKRALLAVLFVAPAAAAVGLPLVQFRMAFFSDAIGHSAFTGVALGVLLGIHPLLTMVAFGLFVAYSITMVKGRSGLSPDTVIGVFFSTVIALGIAVISAQKGLTRNLQSYLYGDLLAVSNTEVLWMAALFLGVAVYLLFAFNRILLLGVHEGFARSLGVRGRALEISFSLVVALVVTTAIRAVGILLVTALLVVPAAAARNVAREAAAAFWAAIAISLASGVAGVAASYYLDTATGATIVLVAAACFALTAILRHVRGETA
ncbi:MAG: metal ABC transporter permease [Deltaproteobacteria bacterium]|nr:metal ABC transporter permease [Candidatus Deferrimicrobiaceae bacterium]